MQNMLSKGCGLVNSIIRQGKFESLILGRKETFLFPSVDYDPFIDLYTFILAYMNCNG